MIEFLAVVGGLGTTAALVAVIVLAFKLVRAKDDIIAAGDQIDKWRGEATTVQGQLASEEAAHAVTTQRFNEERDLRAVAESKLNQAYREAREDAIKIIAGMDPDAAAHYGNHILSAPLPGVRLSETADGHLEKP